MDGTLVADAVSVSDLLTLSIPEASKGVSTFATLDILNMDPRRVKQ